MTARSGRRLAALVAGVILIVNLARAEPSVEVTTTSLSKDTLSETITAYGRVQPDPDHVSSITLPRAGIISRLWVSLGQRVAAGDALLELDTAPTAQMAYEQAQAAVDFARGDLRRLERLFKEQLATRDQVDGARRTLEDAESQLTAQQKLGTGQSREIIRAPFKGIVTQVAVTQGQRIQADTAALLIASGEALIVPLGVEPEDAGRLTPGMPVTLASVFEPALSISATLGQVHAMVNPATRLVDALVRIPETAATSLVLDSTMRAIITLRTQETLAVPREAVLTDEQGAYLFVVRTGKAHRVDVETGLSQGGRVGVRGALTEGDAVVTSGNYELQDGMAVRESKR